ncbi:MAG: FlgD immunoglobulin-like domain containing protein [Armatimonadota bacterium]|nr:FlgD immunoglobulin-like domain containing protein [Armatimonadota bacterium]
MITGVFVTINGLPVLPLASVGGGVYRAAIRGSDIGVGTHSLGVLVTWQTDQPQNPVTAAWDPNTLIVVPRITNVLSRTQLWRERTLFEDEVLAATDPLQRDPLRPDPLDLLAPDDGSSSTRYRYRVVYRHPFGIPPQPIYTAFTMNGLDGSFEYEFAVDTFMPPPPSTQPPHATPIWGTGRKDTNDFGGVYLYIDGEPHWMVPVYKFDSAGNPVPLGTLTPQDFQNGVVYEYIWEPTHYASQTGDTRYGLPYKYGRPTDNAFVVGAYGAHSYEFRAGVDHFPTEDSQPAVYQPGNPLQDPDYPLLSLEHPRITPVLSGFRVLPFQPNFLHLDTVRRADGDTTVFWNPDQQLPNGPFHPQPGPTPPGSQSFPVAMGTEDTVFEFRIYYEGDRDPAYIKVFISNDFTGSSYPIQLTMQPENPAQTNPGVYVARTRLPRGPHTYYFEANDGTRTVRFPVRPLDDPVLPAGGIHTKGRNFFMGPFVNSKPVLSDFSVTPATGKQGTNYTFRVKYTDPNNQRPVRARLHIQLSDDPAPRGTWVTVNMVRESPESVPFTEGVVYRFDTSSDPRIVLQPGTRHYYFEFVDNWGDPFDPNTLLPGETVLLPANATTDPEDDANKVVVENTIAGPIVVRNLPPYLVKPQTVVGTDVSWTPNPADVGGDFLASDTFQNTATSFTFRTKYVDKNNDAPTFIKVQYRNTSDPGRIFERDLNIAPGSGTLHSDGVTYQVTGIKLPIGQAEFRFTASDGTEVVTTDWQAGPNVVANTAPQLLVPAGGTVSPATGDQGTLYTFRVVYKDAEGQPPLATNGGFIRVWIDGTEYDMTPASTTPDYVNGAVFEYATLLGAEPAVHQYYFVASDGGNTVRLPETGTYSGPSVNDFNKLSNPRVSITPAGNAEPRGRSDATYTFQITFTNPSGAPPTGENFAGTPPARVIEVLIDGTAYELTARQPANPTRDDFINGVTYSLTLNAPNAPLVPGRHTFQFRFKGGAFTTPEQTVAVNHKPELRDHKVTMDGSTAVTQVSKTARPIFLVTYRDADNDAPKFVRLFIDSAAGVNMTSTGGTNYRAGVVYRYQTPAPLALGSHTYRIAAQDADPFAEDAAEVSGTFEVVNFAPRLSDASVAPSTGSHNAAFTYSVKYTDDDGDAPAYVRVRIFRADNTEQVLNLTGSGDYARGVTFTGTVPANSRLPLGDYRYRFEASDGEATAQLEGNGPTVTNAKPRLSNGTVTPVRESGRAAFRYAVTYTDEDGDAPEFVRVVVIQPNGSEITLDMTGSGTDYTTGVIYTAEVPASSNLAPGNYGFRFIARDNYGADADPLPGTGPQVNNPPQLLNGRVTPTSGKLSTEYVYEVTYKDADNDAPRPFAGTPGGEVQVNIDGTWYAMNRVGTGTDFRGGVTYQLRRRLSEGTHTFYFRTQDQFDLVETPVQTGPTVNRATITLTAPTGTAVLGQTVTLNGQLTLSGPTTTNTTVQIFISPPVGTGEVKAVSIAADGSFSAQFTPGVTGPWSAYASWGGDENYDGVNSATVTINVSGASFTIPAGVSMISIPLLPPSGDPDFLFGFNTATINLIRWSPLEGRYLTADSVRAEAGAAYWVRTSRDTPVTPTGTLADQTQPFAIPLARGWNMIGSVYLQPTLLGAAQVRVAGQLLSLSEAARRGLIRDYAWRYDPASRAYRQVGAGDLLQPFVGYWIRALADVELVLNPPGSRAAEVTRTTRSAKMSESDWSVQLVARAGQVVDSDNYIGVSDEGAQVEKPAPLEEYVHLQLRSPEGNALAVDVRRSTTAKQVYTFEVLTDLPNTPVTLSWPNLAKVARHLEMVLVDLDANVRRAMTAVPSYTYHSGAQGGTRRFQIIVQPRVRTAPVISNVRVAQTRSAGSTRVQISYALSAEASVAVQITDATGKPVRALQAGQAAGRGVNSVTWDGRNGTGIAVPAGAYLVRITATTEDGQTASVVQPIVLTR